MSGPRAKTRAGAEAYLAAIASQRDEEVELAPAALALASLDRPMVGTDRYHRHLARLGEETADRPEARTGSLDGRIAAINGVLFEGQGYEGDRKTYDDLQNANLMHVIDRRKGLPIALGILYLHAARAMGWAAAGVNFPGHFLVRLFEDGRSAVVDPFNGGATYGAAELRGLLKAIMGADAELSREHYVAATNRGILLRLQNNIKTRLLQASDYRPALAVVERMILIAPDNAELWHEAGLLNGQLGNLMAAIECLRTVVKLDSSAALQRQIAVHLQQLEAKLN